MCLAAALGFVAVPHQLFPCGYAQGVVGRRTMVLVSSSARQQIVCAAGLEKHHAFADFVVDLQARICKVSVFHALHVCLRVFADFGLRALCACTRVHACMHASVYAMSICACMYACACADPLCMCVRVWVCVHIWEYAQNSCVEIWHELRFDENADLARTQI